MSIRTDLDVQVSLLTERALLGTTGLERSTAMDDLRTMLELRSASEDPRLAAMLGAALDGSAGPKSMSEWIEERSTHNLSNPISRISVHTLRAATPEQPALERVIERDMTTASWNSAVPPAYLWDAWLPSIGVRRVVDAMSTPLRLKGVPTDLRLPKTTTPTSVEVQATQNTAPTPVDPAVTDVTATEATLFTYVNVSRAAFERQAGTKEATGTEVTTALFRRQAAQFIAGTGASGQLLGLANQAGISAATTAVTTAAGQISALLGVAQQCATAAGSGLEDLVVCAHPRRLAFWLASGSASREAGGATYVGGLRCVTDPAIRTNLGGGTEDEVLVAWPQATLWLEPEPFTFEWDQPAGPATVRVGVWSRVGLLVRLPAAVGRLSGAGLVTPTF